MTQLATTTKPDEKAIKKALTEHGEDVYKAYVDITALTRDVVATNLDYYYTVGRKFAAVHTKHQRGATDALAEACGLNSDTVLKTMAFANMYSADDLKELKKLDYMNWSHIRVLLGVESKKLRGDLQKAVSKQRLSWQELNKLIQQKRGKKGSGGRPPLAATPMGSVQQILSMSKRWVEAEEPLGQHLQVLAGMDSDSISEALLGTVSDLVTELETLAGHAQADANTARQTLEQLKTKRPVGPAGGTDADEEPEVAPSKPAPTKPVKSVPAKKAAGGAGRNGSIRALAASRSAARKRSA